MDTVNLFNGWTAICIDVELSFFKNEEEQKLVILPKNATDIFSIIKFDEDEIEISEIHWNSKATINYKNKQIKFSKIDPDTNL